jgi:hypothetical protein
VSSSVVGVAGSDGGTFVDCDAAPNYIACALVSYFVNQSGSCSL